VKSISNSGHRRTLVDGPGESWRSMIAIFVAGTRRCVLQSPLARRRRRTGVSLFGDKSSISSTRMFFFFNELCLSINKRLLESDAKSSDIQNVGRTLELSYTNIGKQPTYFLRPTTNNLTVEITYVSQDIQPWRPDSKIHKNFPSQPVTWLIPSPVQD
jgi:hypothetical protein